MLGLGETEEEILRVACRPAGARGRYLHHRPVSRPLGEEPSGAEVLLRRRSSPTWAAGEGARLPPRRVGSAGPQFLYGPSCRRIHRRDGACRRSRSLTRIEPKIATESKTAPDRHGGSGIRVSHVCGGDGACGTCRIEVVEGWDHLTPQTPDEIYKELEAPYRLSCQCRLLGDVVVRVAPIE
jgi:ferredoxin